MKNQYSIFMLISCLFIGFLSGCGEEGDSSDSFFGFDEFESGELAEDTPNGKALLRASLNNYVLSGEMKNWYKNGQLQLRQSFVDGHAFGDYETWYSNGQRRFYGSYASGKYRTWHANGALSLVTDSLTAEAEPAMLEWNEQGEIIRESLKNEKGEVYKQRLYYPGVKLGAEGALEAGQKRGIWRYYDQSGKLLHELDHEGGKQLSNKPLPKMGLAGLVDADDMGLEDIKFEPEPLNMAAIEKKIAYPMVALDAEIEGQVNCRLTITRSGEAVNYQIISSPHPILSSAVIARVLQIRFKPLKGKNTFKIYQVNIPFNFALVD
ncbi:MAG: TonB family protein [Bacteroidota bacterium]